MSLLLKKTTPPLLVVHRLQNPLKRLLPLPNPLRSLPYLNRLRLQLSAPLKHELALAGLLAEWRGLMATTETRR